MTVVFSDAFTEGGGSVALSAHTPTGAGSSWTLLWQSAAGVDINATAGDVCEQETQTNNGAMYTADASYDAADYDFEITMVTLDNNATKSIILAVRVQDIDNMYAVRLHDQGAVTGTCQLYKKVAGTWSTLGSAFTPPANASVVKLSIIGTDLKFYDDGVEVASASDSDISAAGTAAIGGGGGAEMIDTNDDMSTANDLDNMTVTTYPAGGPTAVKDPICSPGVIPWSR